MIIPDQSSAGILYCRGSGILFVCVYGGGGGGVTALCPSQQLWPCQYGQITY